MPLLLLKVSESVLVWGDIGSLVRRVCDLGALGWVERRGGGGRVVDVGVFPLPHRVEVHAVHYSVGHKCRW